MCFPIADVEDRAEQGPPRQLPQQQVAACGSDAAPPDPRPSTHGGHGSRQPAAQPPKQAVPNRSTASKAPAGTESAVASQPAPLQRRPSDLHQGSRQDDDGSAMQAVDLPEKRMRVERDDRPGSSRPAQAVAAQEASRLQQHTGTDATPARDRTHSAARQQATPRPGSLWAQPGGRAHAPQQQASGRGPGAGAASTQRHADDGVEARRAAAPPVASRPHKQALELRSPASKVPTGTDSAGALQPAPLQHRQSGPDTATRQEGDGGTKRAGQLPEKRTRAEVESDKLRMAQVQSSREERRARAPKGGADASETRRERRAPPDPRGSAPDAAPGAADRGNAGDHPTTAEPFLFRQSLAFHHVALQSASTAPLDLCQHRIGNSMCTKPNRGAAADCMPRSAIFARRIVIASAAFIQLHCCSLTTDETHRRPLVRFCRRACALQLQIRRIALSIHQASRQ